MLSFYGNNTAWNVDKSGDYRTDCDNGRLLADEFMRHPTPELLLPHIVLSMVELGPLAFGPLETAFLTAVAENVR